MYKIILPNFEGPFDLLLFFIKRDELNIYDIPISKITEEFLNYIKLMQYFDIELAGEFVLMASTLMYIKSQMLLPRPKEDDEGEIEDPRTGLVQKLLEYKIYKDAANDLKERAEDNKYIYYKSLFQADKDVIESSADYRNTNLFELLKAFKIAINRVQDTEPEYEINLEPITLADKKEIITNMLSRSKRISFFEITHSLARAHIIVTFLAILELMKNQIIWIYQDNNFDDIIIVNRESVQIPVDLD